MLSVFYPIKFITKTLIIITLSIVVQTILLAQESRRTIHVFVALCDNKTQGIRPVPKKLGDGNDPDNNLYWGAAFGVKTFFTHSKNWKIIDTQSNISEYILERLIFVHKNKDTFLIADAYRGKNIEDAIDDLLRSSAGLYDIQVQTEKYGSIAGGYNADLLVYVGHNALIDIWLPTILYKRVFKAYPKSIDNGKLHNVFILACKSKEYFDVPLQKSNSYPLLWTKTKLAPEAYTLEGVLEGWIKDETGEQLIQRAAKAYSTYQKCSLRAAKTIFASGW